MPDDAGVRELVQDVLQHYGSQAHTRAKLATTGAQISLEGSSLRDQQRFLRESAAALLEARDSSTDLASARQQFDTDLENFQRQLEANASVHMRHRDLVMRSRSEDGSLMAKLEGLAIHFYASIR